MKFHKIAFPLGALASAALVLCATSAMALPFDWQMGFQPSASPVMDEIESFHRELFYIITAVCIFVAALLGYVIVKFRASANPVPSKVHHNTLLEVAWTLIPVIILVVIAIPSFKLLYYEAEIPTPDVHIKAIADVAVAIRAPSMIPVLRNFISRPRPSGTRMRKPPGVFRFLRGI